MRPNTVKICGITRTTDARACLKFGADALGFIFHPTSPRNLTLDKFRGLFAGLDFGKCRKVAVAVSPDISRVEQLIEAGFDKFQFHFSPDISEEKISQWSSLIGRENLWLAPRLESSTPLPDYFLKYAKVFLIDAYSEKSYGGTGKLADWEKFAELKEQHPDHQWFLAGGLGPENLADALSRLRPDGVDLNSGVEKNPGIKDTQKLSEVFSKLI